MSTEIQAKVVDILIDTSGSMRSPWSGKGPDGKQEKRIEVVLRVLQRHAREKLDDQQIVGLRLFGGDGVKTIVPLRPGARADVIKTKVPSPDGLTPLFDAIRTSAKELQRFPSPKRILVLSDGGETYVTRHLPTDTPEDKKRALIEDEKRKLIQELLSLGLEMGEQEGLRIDIVGIGLSGVQRIDVEDIAGKKRVHNVDDATTVLGDAPADPGIKEQQLQQEVDSTAGPKQATASANSVGPSLQAELSQVRQKLSEQKTVRGLLWTMIALQILTLVAVFAWGFQSIRPVSDAPVQVLQDEVISTRKQLEIQTKQFERMIDILIEQTKPR